MPKTNFIKIVIAGDGGVGKTVLTHRYISDNYDQNIRLTKGVDFFTFEIDRNGSRYNLVVWDLAGQRQFEFFLGDFINGSMGGMVLFDFSRYFTILNIEKWIDLINESGVFPILLVGSKFDLVKENEPLISSYESQIEKIMSKRENCFDYIRISTKDNLNVKESFDLLLNYLFERRNERNPKIIEKGDFIES